MAPYIAVPVYNILCLLFLVVTFAVIVSSDTISDLRLCADSKCEGTISYAQVLAPYRSNDPIFLTFKRGDLIAVKSKSAGKRPDLWGGEINGKRGYFPKAFVREIEVQIDEPSTIVPTEKQTTITEKVMGMTEPSHQPEPPPGQQDDSPPSNLKDAPPSLSDPPPPEAAAAAAASSENRVEGAQPLADAKETEPQQELKFEPGSQDPKRAKDADNVVEMSAGGTRKHAEKDETEVEDETEPATNRVEVKPKERNPYDLDDTEFDDDTEIPDDEDDEKTDDSSDKPGGFFSAEPTGHKDFEQGLQDLHDTLHGIDSMVSERNKVAGTEALNSYISNALGGDSGGGEEKPTTQETPAPTVVKTEPTQPAPTEAPPGDAAASEGTPPGKVPPSDVPVEGTLSPPEQPAVPTEQPSVAPPQTTALPQQAAVPPTQPPPTPPQQPAGLPEQSNVQTKPPPTLAQQPAGLPEQPTAQSDQPLTSPQQSAVLPEQPEPTKQQGVQSEQPVAPSDQQTAPPEQPVIATEQPAVQGTDTLADRGGSAEAMSGQGLPGSSSTQPLQNTQLPVAEPSLSPEAVPASVPPSEKEPVVPATDHLPKPDLTEGSLSAAGQSQPSPGSDPQEQHSAGEEGIPTDKDKSLPGGANVPSSEAPQTAEKELLPSKPAETASPPKVADQPTSSQASAAVPVQETVQRDDLTAQQPSASAVEQSVVQVQPSVVDSGPAINSASQPTQPEVEVVTTSTQPVQVETALPQSGGQEMAPQASAELPELQGSMAGGSSVFQQAAATPELHPQSDSAAAAESSERFIVIDGTRIPVYDDEENTDETSVGEHPASVPSPPVSQTVSVVQQLHPKGEGKGDETSEAAVTPLDKEDKTRNIDIEGESDSSQSQGAVSAGQDQATQVDSPTEEPAQNASGGSREPGIAPPVVNLESTMKEIIDVYTTDEFLNRKTLSVSGGPDDKSIQQQATQLPGHQPTAHTGDPGQPPSPPAELSQGDDAKSEQAAEPDKKEAKERTDPDGAEEHGQSPSTEEEGKGQEGIAETLESPGSSVTPPSVEDPNEVPPPPQDEVTIPSLGDPLAAESDFGQKVDDRMAEEEQVQAPSSPKETLVTGGSGFLESLMRRIIDKLPPWLQSALEQEPLGLSPHLTVLFTIVSFVSMVTISACSCCSGGSGVGAKKQNALAVVRKLEEEVFVLRKERENLEEALSTAKKQAEDMNKHSRKQLSKSGLTESELQNVQLHNSALKQQVADLQAQLQEIQSEGSLAKDALKLKDKKVKEFEKEISQLKERLAHFERDLTEKCSQLQAREEEVQGLQSQGTALSQQVQLLETSKQQLLQQADDWREKVKELKDQLTQRDAEFRQMQETLAFKENEQEVLKDCFLQLKAFEEKQSEDEVDSTDSSDMMEKIQAMTDVSRVNAQLLALQDDKETMENKLKIEYEARQELEDQLASVRREMESTQMDRKKSERQCAEAQTKLAVLSNYFKEKEMQMQRELGEHEAMKKQNVNKLESADERVKMIEQERELFKQQVESMKRELESSEKDFRVQIAVNEKKAHENWLAARAAERELKEMRHDAAMLRQRLTDLERRPMHGPGGLIRPLPTRGMPPPGMLNGPPPPPGAERGPPPPGMERGPPPPGMERGLPPPGMERGPPPPGMERGPPPPGMERGPPPPGTERSPSRGSLPPLPPHLRDDEYGPPPDRRLPPGSRIRSPPHHGDARSPPPPPYGRGLPPPMERGTPPYRFPPGDMMLPLRGPPLPQMMGSPPPLRMEPPGPRTSSPYRGPRPPPPNSKSPRQQSQV